MNRRLGGITSGLVNVFAILCVVAYFPALANAGRTMEITDIDLQVSPNPIPCGGSAEATVTVRTYPVGQLSEGVHTQLTLWDHDTLFRDGDDALDHESIVLSEDEGKVTATMTLRCQIKDAGCGLYGPAGNSGESGTEVFVTILGSDVESPHVYVKCQQMSVDAELGIDGTESIIAGNKATVTVSAVQPITNLHHASWKIEYNSNDITVKNVEYLNQSIAAFTSHTINTDHILFTVEPQFFPVTMSGPIVQVKFSSKFNPENLWDTTYIGVSDDSSFFSLGDSKIDVCTGGAHSLFIAPRDTTPPQIVSKKIVFNPMQVSGTAGAVYDDIGALENYLTVALYDENNILVSQEFANIDGSFTLDKFFKLDRDSPSRLMLYNGLNLSDTYLFTPTVMPTGAITLLLSDSDKPPAASIILVAQTPPPGGPIVNINVQATDPEGSEISVQIDWGDGDMTVYSPLQPSGSFFTADHNYAPAPASYLIRARAKNSKGLEGPWSDTYELVITP